MTAKRGVLFGVGLGPGDPELMTMKASRIVSSASVVAYFRKRGNSGHARTIANALISKSATEIALDYPVTTEVDFRDDVYVDAMRDFYTKSAANLISYLNAGRDVALLCEGDPFFYGSFLHMYDRIKSTHDVEVIPGISGMSGCWTAADQPITYGDDVMSVLPGTLDGAVLIDHLNRCDAAVIMKVGKNLEKIRHALQACGRLKDAIYVERGTMTGQKVLQLADFKDQPAPYFSIILVPGGRGRRVV